MVELINHYQGVIRVIYYSMKLTELSKYAPCFVSNPRDKMNHFLTGVSDDLKEECYSAMIHDNMIISRAMVLAQHMEESRSEEE